MAPTRPTSRHGFEIAIICALTIEADAYWDDEYSFGKASGDPNAYTTSSISYHNVVLAHMPGMGKINAAVTSYPNIKLALVVGVCGAVPFVSDSATEIILGDIIISSGVVQYDFGRRLPERFTSYPNIKLALVVGVCGAVPFVSDSATEIILGDIIISSGVVQYDFGRRLPEHSLGRPNLEIRAQLEKLEGRRSKAVLKKKIISHLVELQKESDLQAHYPGAAHDKLFIAHYRHLGDGKTCEECGCNGELISRRRFEQNDIQPAVHFGFIASSDAVMKFGQDSDK
ncbi:unnamed protein product, partial [Clonostachys chloroleuca]